MEQIQRKLTNKLFFKFEKPIFGPFPPKNYFIPPIHS